jgi:ATP-dependent RNA helicase RhlE
MKFEELNLIPPILKALKDENYEEPTSIQERAIPIVLEGRDVLGSAQTGTGKTAAFSIPIIQHLVKKEDNISKKRKISTLIVTPTRELAIQIGESITTYAKYTDVTNTVIFGGVKQGKQTDALKKSVDILVATPGRLLDLIQQGFISLKEIEFFVLDEADRMLDMGFINDIKKIIKLLPKKRQSLFFSATMPKSIVELSNKILVNPKKVAVDVTSSAADTVQQLVYFTNKKSKSNLLLHILNQYSMDQVLLFSRTKHGANRIVRNLHKKKINAAAIHGDRSQNQRQKALADFKNGKIKVLVATDIAARGIDIDKLRYVINYDIPNEPETYVHRIGRCGRAGEEGIAISISEPEENAYVKDIEKLIKQKIEVESDNPYPQTDKPMTRAEKKEFDKEKNIRKQQQAANRRKNKEKRQGGNKRKGRK